LEKYIIAVLIIMSKYLRLFLTGFGMGTADIIPGVSGGTIAFIFGIYEELITSIKTVTGETLKLVTKGKIKDAVKAVPFGFLVPLFAGIATAILLLARTLEHLLETQPVFIRAFFFGLVIASGYLVSRQIKRWSTKIVVAMTIALVLSFILVGIVPVATPDTALAFFLSGAIAIIAMILPGVSGAFLLLILGKYNQVLNAVVEFDLLTIGLVAAGAVLGLALFSRVLSWLFKNYHDLVVAALTGLMLGSLRKLWPWKEVLKTGLDRHGETVVLQEANMLPTVFDGVVLTAMLLTVAGAVIILYLTKLQEQNKA